MEAGGTNQRLKPGPATMRSLEKKWAKTALYSPFRLCDGPASTAGHGYPQSGDHTGKPDDLPAGYGFT